MNKYFFAAVMFFVLVASGSAQLNQYQMASVHDDFCRWSGQIQKVTTELVPCSPTSNIYTRIDIHRNYGIPRFGIITDCTSQILDTVWYVPNVFGRFNGVISPPEETATSITVFWEETLFSVKIMNILTGEIVLDETHSGQASGLFASLGTNVLVPVDPDLPEITFPGGTPSVKTSDNPGTTIDFSDIPDGLYFLYIVDVGNSTIPYMKTIRKNIGI